MPIDLTPFAAVLLDLDGTIYHEDHPLPGAIEFIRHLERENRKFACLTNHTSSPARIAARLARMGVTLDESHIYTAGAAACDYVLEKWPNNPSIFNLATEGVQQMLDGKVRWANAPDDVCDAIICGTFVSKYATEDRQRAALTILRANRATQLIGCCADRVYPSPRGIEFGSGAFTRMLAYAASVAEPIFCGKPEPIFFRELCERLHVAPQRCLLIGDNLESDIAGGKRMGMRTILTLTGVTREPNLEALRESGNPNLPDQVISDLSCLILPSE
jgi:4-nitrophenyl phosphatase